MQATHGTYVKFIICSNRLRKQLLGPYKRRYAVEQEAVLIRSWIDIFLERNTRFFCRKFQILYSYRVFIHVTIIILRLLAELNNNSTNKIHFCSSIVYSCIKKQHCRIPSRSVLLGQRWGNRTARCSYLSYVIYGRHVDNGYLLLDKMTALCHWQYPHNH